MNAQYRVYQARYSIITMYEISFMTAKAIYGTFNNAMIIIFGRDHIVSSLFESINTFFAWFLLWSFVWRFWSISYDIKWTKYIINHQWKIIINPSHADNMYNNKAESESNWYLTHKQFGSAKFCFFFIVLPFYIIINVGQHIFIAAFCAFLS